MDCRIKPGNDTMPPMSMNLFDAAIYVCLAVAVIAGFSSGLLRSLATIFGYVAAAPVALAAAPYLTPILADQFKLPPSQAWLAYAGIFLVIGFVLGALLRLAISELVGPDISAPDRMAGAFLGAVRVGLLAVLIVVIFDRVIPAEREPAFLTGSQLRPILSQAGLAGLKSLPPDIAAYIDRLKRERGI
jgi:membrane protein required for colicin V production